MGDGKTKIIRAAAQNLPSISQLHMAEIRAVLAKFSFRQLPPDSVRFRRHPTHVRKAAGRWKGGNYYETDQKFRLNGRNKGGVGQIQLPSASADTQHICGRELEDGKGNFLRGTVQKFPQMA